MEKPKGDKFGKERCTVQRSSEEANRLKVDTDFVQSDWPAWKKRYSIKILGNPIGWLCNFGYNRTGFFRGMPVAQATYDQTFLRFIIFLEK